MTGILKLIDNLHPLKQKTEDVFWGAVLQNSTLHSCLSMCVCVCVGGHGLLTH